MSLMGYGTAGPGRARRPWRWRCLARSSSSRPFWPRGSFDGSERGIATAPAAGGVGGGGRSHHLGVGAPLEAAVALAVCDDACPADRADPARRRTAPGLAAGHGWVRRLVSAPARRRPAGIDAARVPTPRLLPPSRTDLPDRPNGPPPPPPRQLP